MKNKFIDDMDIKGIQKYKKPIMVTMSGLPGSGKTYFAQELSRNLKIFLLSNDYIRNYYLNIYGDTEDTRKDVSLIVNRVNKQRMFKLLLNRKSFIYDSDINSIDEFEKFILISDLLNYDLLKIKINSPSDEINLQRIAKRNMDYSFIDDTVIGDNVNYSRAFSKEIYEDIRRRKPRLIDDTFYDYVVDNYGTRDEFNDQINGIMEKIIPKLIIKR